MRGFRPGRGASLRIPSTRRSANLERHLPTVTGFVSSSPTICLFVLPFAARRMIFERRTRRCGVDLPRDHLSNCLRSSGVRTIVAARRMITYYEKHTYVYFCYTPLGYPRMIPLRTSFLKAASHPQSCITQSSTLIITSPSRTHTSVRWDSRRVFLFC